MPTALIISLATGAGPGAVAEIWTGTGSRQAIQQSGSDVLGFSSADTRSYSDSGLKSNSGRTLRRSSTRRTTTRR